VVTNDTAWDALRSVNDPEYPLSIVDLGMVYDVRVENETANVSMTFTSIGCPAIDMIVGDVRDALTAIPGIEHVEVEIVWSPPWTKDKISDRGKKVLAIYGVVN
jgi:phenylacetate-CoA oxygenase PaaJ subunit